MHFSKKNLAPQPKMQLQSQLPAKPSTQITEKKLLN